MFSAVSLPWGVSLCVDTTLTEKYVVICIFDQLNSAYQYRDFGPLLLSYHR